MAPLRPVRPSTRPSPARAENLSLRQLLARFRAGQPIDALRVTWASQPEPATRVRQNDPKAARAILKAGQPLSPPNAVRFLHRIAGAEALPADLRTAFVAAQKTVRQTLDGLLRDELDLSRVARPEEARLHDTLIALHDRLSRSEASGRAPQGFRSQPPAAALLAYVGEGLASLTTASTKEGLAKAREVLAPTVLFTDPVVGALFRDLRRTFDAALMKTPPLAETGDDDFVAAAVTVAAPPPAPLRDAAWDADLAIVAKEHRSGGRFDGPGAFRFLDALDRLHKHPAWKTHSADVQPFLAAKPEAEIVLHTAVVNVLTSARSLLEIGLPRTDRLPGLFQELERALGRPEVKVHQQLLKPLAVPPDELVVLLKGARDAVGGARNGLSPSVKALRGLRDSFYEGTVREVCDHLLRAIALAPHEQPLAPPARTASPTRSFGVVSINTIGSRSGSHMSHAQLPFTPVEDGPRRRAAQLRAELRDTPLRHITAAQVALETQGAEAARDTLEALPRLVRKARPDAEAAPERPVDPADVAAAERYMLSKDE